MPRNNSRARRQLRRDRINAPRQCTIGTSPGEIFSRPDYGLACLLDEAGHCQTHSTDDIPMVGLWIVTGTRLDVRGTETGGAIVAYAPSEEAAEAISVHLSTCQFLTELQVGLWDDDREYAMAG